VLEGILLVVLGKLIVEQEEDLESLGCVGVQTDEEGRGKEREEEDHEHDEDGNLALLQEETHSRYNAG
jgi:hypothetical protein